MKAPISEALLHSGKRRKGKMMRRDDSVDFRVDASSRMQRIPRQMPVKYVTGQVVPSLMLNNRLACLFPLPFFMRNHGKTLVHHISGSHTGHGVL